MKSLLIILISLPLIVHAEKKVNTETLRDSKGHKTGVIKHDNGVEKIYDDKYHYRGQYRSSNNTTRDDKGHKIGTGNQNINNLKK